MPVDRARAGRGVVLIARQGPQIAGHLQLTSDGQPGQAEVKNMAVREDRQGQGLGRQLMQAALSLLAAEGVTTVRVATAAADTGNLRFYQRQGSGCRRRWGWVTAGTAEGVIATKLFRPGPRQLTVERKRLHDLLREGSSLPLTLVVAPAGCTGLTCAGTAAR